MKTTIKVLLCIMMIGLVSAGLFSVTTSVTYDRTKLNVIKSVRGWSDVDLDRGELYKLDGVWRIDKICKEEHCINQLQADGSLSEEDAIKQMSEQALDGLYKSAKWKQDYDSRNKDVKDDGGIVEVR